MDIKHSPAGKVVKSIKGYYAFIPHPLPPSFPWDNTFASSLSRADHAIGMLALEGKKLPNPHLFIRPFITKEAVLSSKIEGTQTTLSEVFAQEAGINTKKNDDLQEVQNYIAALDYGIERLKNFPLSLRFIRELHNLLMQGVRGSHATPGHFRTSQNWIGHPGSTLMNAKYVPPLPEELGQCLADF